MTVSINLTKGYSTTIDDTDADLAGLKWRVGIYKTSNTQYAIRSIPETKKTMFLHRVILERITGCPLLDGETVDHIDGNGLNNLRSNLRIATTSQNMKNRSEYSNSPTGLKGVFKNPDSKNRIWKTAIRVNGKSVYLGTFYSVIEAHRVFCINALIHYGEFANFGNRSPFRGWTLEQLREAEKSPLPLTQELAA